MLGLGMSTGDDWLRSLVSLMLEIACRIDNASIRDSVEQGTCSPIILELYQFGSLGLAVLYLMRNDAGGRPFGHDGCGKEIMLRGSRL